MKIIKGIKKLVKRFRKEEDGAILIIVAVAMTVIMGMTAFVVDMGIYNYKKSTLQTACDSAALAAARSLPDAAATEIAAKDYIVKNGFSAEDVVVEVVVDEDDGDMVRVTSARQQKTLFANVLGVKKLDYKCTAMARAQDGAGVWANDAMPFMNLDDDYTTLVADPQGRKVFEIWEKTGPGDFESLWKDSYNYHNEHDPANFYFSLNFSTTDNGKPGLMITKGTVATIKQEVGYVYAQDKPVYVYSLRSDIIQSGKYGGKVLKNKVVIPLEDLVLIKIKIYNYNESEKKLYVEFLGEVYDFNNGVYPTEHLHNYSKSGASLVN